MLSPVILFAYNRPRHLQCTLDALNKNTLAEGTELFIFCDGAKGEKDRCKVDETRSVIEQYTSISNFKKVKTFYSDENKGLANSVISGVSQILQEFETVIVLEDDIVTSLDFLEYMNDCLGYYRNDGRVGAISAYTPAFHMPRQYRHDLFLSRRGNSWGWATWREIWEKTDWEVSDFVAFVQDKTRRDRFNATQYRAVEMLDQQMSGQIDSWAIRWDYSFFERGLYTVYPTKTKVYNIGCDGSGTHKVNEDQRNIKLEKNSYTLEPLDVNEKIIRLSSENICFIRKIINGIIRIIKRI